MRSAFEWDDATVPERVEECDDGESEEEVVGEVRAEKDRLSRADAMVEGRGGPNPTGAGTGRATGAAAGGGGPRLDKYLSKKGKLPSEDAGGVCTTTVVPDPLFGSGRVGTGASAARPSFFLFPPPTCTWTCWTTLFWILP